MSSIHRILSCQRDPSCKSLFADPVAVLSNRDPKAWPTHFCAEPALLGVHRWAADQPGALRPELERWRHSWPLPVGVEAYGHLIGWDGWPETLRFGDLPIPFEGDELAALILRMPTPGARITFFGLVEPTNHGDPGEQMPYRISNMAFTVAGRTPASNAARELIDNAERWWRERTGELLPMRGGRPPHDPETYKVDALRVIEEALEREPSCKPRRDEVAMALFGIERGGRRLAYNLAPYTFSDLIDEVRRKRPDLF